MTGQPDTRWAQPHQRPGADHRVPFSVLDGGLLAAWSILGQLVVGVVVGTALALGGVDPGALDGPSLLAVTLVIQSLVLAGALAWLAGRGALTWRLWGSARPSLRHVGTGIAGGLAAWVAALVVVAVGTVLVGPLEDPGQSLVADDNLAGTSLVFVVVIAVLAGPVMEELTHRGALFQALGRRTGPMVAAVVSALVFALAHVEVVLPLGANSFVFTTALFVVGMVFAGCLYWGRSLVVAIVAHAVFNGVQLLLAVTATDLAEGLTSLTSVFAGGWVGP